MRWKSQYNNSDDFVGDIQEEIKESGFKNAVCVLLGNENEITVITANEENGVELTGMMDVGKSLLFRSLIDDE